MGGDEAGGLEYLRSGGFQLRKIRTQNKNGRKIRYAMRIVLYRLSQQRPEVVSSFLVSSLHHRSEKPDRTGDGVSAINLEF